MECEVWPWLPPTCLALSPPLSYPYPNGPLELLKDKNIILLGISKANCTAGHALSAKQWVLNCTRFFSPFSWQVTWPGIPLPMPP